MPRGSGGRSSGGRSSRSARRPAASDPRPAINLGQMVSGKPQSSPIVVMMDHILETSLRAELKNWIRLEPRPARLARRDAQPARVDVLKTEKPINTGRVEVAGSLAACRVAASIISYRTPVQAPAPPPAPLKSAPAGGLGSVVAEGMAFGGGNAIAHRAVDSILGPRTSHVASPAPAPEAATMNSLGGSVTCGVQSKAFQDCLNNHGTDISKCQFYLDMLSECRKGSGAGLSV